MASTGSNNECRKKVFLTTGWMLLMLPVTQTIIPLHQLSLHEWEILFFIIFTYLWFITNNIKLSVPPIWIYIPSESQLSPLSFGIFKSVCWYGKFVFILILPTRSVRQKWRRTVLRASDSRKRCSRAWTIFNSRDPFTYYCPGARASFQWVDRT